MSQWTHINGSVRMDFFTIGAPIVEPVYKTVNFQNEKRKWTECNTPRGSEGSITIGRTVVYETANQAFITYSYSGDLRDYGSDEVEDEFLPWIDKIVSDMEGAAIIRQGIFEIDIEGSSTMVFLYDNDEFKFKKVV